MCSQSTHANTNMTKLIILLYFLNPNCLHYFCLFISMWNILSCLIIMVYSLCFSLVLLCLEAMLWMHKLLTLISYCRVTTFTPGWEMMFLGYFYELLSVSSCFCMSVPFCSQATAWLTAQILVFSCPERIGRSTSYLGI